MTDHTPPEVYSSQPTPYTAYLPYVPPAPAPAPAVFVAPVQAPIPQPTGVAITSFVLGLVSIFFGFVFVVPLLGLVLGILALRKEPKARGFAIAGIWINAVMLGLVFVSIVIVVLLLVLGPSLAPLFSGVTNVNPSTPA